MLFSNNKVEIRLGKFSRYEMATLIARRLHNFANDKSLSPNYHKMGLHFITSSSGNKTELFIASTKLTQLEPADVYMFATLMKTYQAILEPFFK